MPALSQRHNPVEGFPKRFGWKHIHSSTGTKSRGFRDKPIEIADFGALRCEILAVQRRFPLHPKAPSPYCGREKSLEPQAGGDVL
jgi:hypothetical protein